MISLLILQICFNHYAEWDWGLIDKDVNLWTKTQVLIPESTLNDNIDLSFEALANVCKDATDRLTQWSVSSVPFIRYNKDGKQYYFDQRKKQFRNDINLH